MMRASLPLSFLVACVVTLAPCLACTNDGNGSADATSEAPVITADDTSLDVPQSTAESGAGESVTTHVPGEPDSTLPPDSSQPPQTTTTTVEWSEITEDTPNRFSIRVPSDWIDVPLDEPEDFDQFIADPANREIAQLVETTGPALIGATRLVVAPDASSGMFLSAIDSQSDTLTDEGDSLIEGSASQGYTVTYDETTLNGRDALRVHTTPPEDLPPAEYDGFSYMLLDGDDLWTLVLLYPSGADPRLVEEIATTLTVG